MESESTTFDDESRTTSRSFEFNLVDGHDSSGYDSK